MNFEMKYRVRQRKVRLVMMMPVL